MKNSIEESLEILTERFSNVPTLKIWKFEGLTFSGEEGKKTCLNVQDGDDQLQVYTESESHSWD